MKEMMQGDKMELPTGWETMKLGEIGKVFNGNSINAKVKEEKYSGLFEGLAFIATKDIGFNSIINYENGVKIPFDDRDRFKIAPAGTPLVCIEGGSAGRKVGFTDQDICFGNKLFALVPNKNVDSRFIYYFYLSEQFQDVFSTEMSGMIGGVSMNKFKSIEIPIPRLSEQQRIVSVLDKTFDALNRAKENAEQTLEKVKELFQGLLNDALTMSNGKLKDGWEKKSLIEVVDNIMTGPFGSMLHKSDYIKDGIPVVNPQNIVGGHIVSLQKTMIGESTFSRLKKYALKFGDIVIARRGEMGRCAVVKKENVGWLCGTGSFVIRVNIKKADSEFLNIILSSVKVKEQLEKSSIGATMSNLNQSILSEISLSVPPLKVQHSIVQKLNTLSAETKKLESIYKQKLNNLEELKKAILQKAFRGELKTEDLLITT